MIWIPTCSIYNGELTLFLAARILFDIYTMSVTYFDLISKGMNISLHCISLSLSLSLSLSHTHTHTHTQSKVTLDTLKNINKHSILIENIRTEIKRLEDLEWTVFFYLGEGPYQNSRK